MNNRKKYLGALAGLLLSFGATAQEAEVWSLEEAIQHAVSNNLTVEQARLDVQQSEINLNQARHNQLPTFNANTQAGFNWGRSIDPTTNDFVNTEIKFASGSVSGNLLLFNGFSLRNNIKSNEANVLASQAQLKAISNNITLSVANQYLNVLFAKEQIRIAESQLETTSEQVDRTRRLVDAGVLPASNLLEFQAQLASNRRDLIQAENSLAIAKLNLKQLLRLPAEEEIEVESPDLDVATLDVLEQSSDEIYQNAEQVLPQIESADKSVESSEYSVESARGEYYPTLSLGGSLRTNYSSLGESRTLIGDPIMVVDTVGYLASDQSELVVIEGLDFERNIESGIGVWQQFDENFSQSAFISLNIPILNGFRTRNNVQRASINQRRAELQALQVRQDLRQSIETAYTDVVTSSESFEASQQQVESLEEAFRATEKQYNVGALNFVDYQLASNNLFRARSELLRARFEYIFKKKILEFYQGQPITLD
ncbi:TolC family protein [Roseivirga sp. BDSF3-8]|uniref:TolC family protein n=1 Tax=Roseivirga sp. BDSF3-8 TaxID=3241598 RepID=UPI0035323BBB